MIEAPRSCVPRLTKGLSRLNDEGEIVVNRDALAMLAAVDGHRSLADLARVHGTACTRDGLAELLEIGAVDLDAHPDDLVGLSLDPRGASAAPISRRRAGAWAPWGVTIAVFVGLLILTFWTGGRSMTPESPSPGVTTEDTTVGPDADVAYREGPDAATASCSEQGACQATGGSSVSTVAPPEAIPAAASAPAPVVPSLATESSQGETSVTPRRADVTPVEAPVGAASHPVATSIAQATSTPPASAVALTGPTPAPTPNGQSASRVILDERFADNRHGWPSDPSSTAWLADGGYRLFARTAARFVAVGAPNTGRLRDVTLTATFRKVGGPPGGGYGFVVRDQAASGRDGVSQDGQFYVLEAGDRGEVGVWRREGDRWVDLVPWMPSDAVRPGGGTNQLTVRAMGPEVTFVVNGTVVASLLDLDPKAGFVGIFAGGNGNEVVLERLIVTASG